MTEHAMELPLTIDQRMLVETMVFNDAAAKQPPLTLAEYDALPYPDDCRQELVRGHIVREPVTGLRHGLLQASIAAELLRHVRSHGLGMIVTGVDAKVTDDPRPTTRVPDIAFIRAERGSLDDFGDERLPFAPDLAIEIVSPHNTAADLQEKVAEYLRAGSEQVWVIYPSTRQIIVHGPGNSIRILAETDELDGGDLLPEFRWNVAALFLV
jgi:Uma2 family endonuclease